MVHLCLGALLAIVSVSAPFAHTHHAGEAEEHLAQEHFTVLHAHIALPGREAALSEVDDSAQRVNWFRFDAKQPIAFAPPATALTLPVPPLDLAAEAVAGESASLPNESPPRAIVPRGPPLFA